MAIVSDEIDLTLRIERCREYHEVCSNNYLKYSKMDKLVLAVNLIEMQ